MIPYNISIVLNVACWGFIVVFLVTAWSAQFWSSGSDEGVKRREQMARDMNWQQPPPIPTLEPEAIIDAEAMDDDYPALPSNIPQRDNLLTMIIREGNAVPVVEMPSRCRRCRSYTESYHDHYSQRNFCIDCGEEKEQ